MSEAKRYFPGEPRVSYVANQTSAMEKADALVIVTEWKEFRSPDFANIKAGLSTSMCRRR